MGRIRAFRWIGAIGIPVALLGGCAFASNPVSSPPTPTSSSPITSAPAETPELSEFEQQLPLSGEFVSQAAETTGTVDIQRREGGSVWIVLENFRTGDETDLRLYLKQDALVQDAEGHWGSSEDGYEIASIDPGASTQEIEVPGAWDMPAMYTLTVGAYLPPDYPALGSAALG
ncbi:hypothetical protein E3T25_07820 [Cryobacterium sandaracinum]|uniref:DM13 domain-containing protein n=1 Tax=Cryobacterium sandaracinum TaxID=1259247 RepID=A0ABY2JCV7_9MICO|nr:hypothetical protein [Cryobacterium sandaracinum]TFD02947.1 hypothetical protein E3T25_07820 [Cryobacterium sandaracinum]